MYQPTLQRYEGRIVCHRCGKVFRTQTGHDKYAGDFRTH